MAAIKRKIGIPVRQEFVPSPKKLVFQNGKFVIMEPTDYSKPHIKSLQGILESSVSSPKNTSVDPQHQTIWGGVTIRGKRVSRAFRRKRLV